MERSHCCLWLDFDKAGSKEAARLPAAHSRSPSELLEIRLGLWTQEKPKLPQTCRHESSKRSGRRTVCEALVILDGADQVAIVLISEDACGKETPCHLCCARSCCSGHHDCLQGCQKGGDVVGAVGLLRSVGGVDPGGLASSRALVALQWEMQTKASRWVSPDWHRSGRGISSKMTS